MEISELTIRIIILLLPGLIGALIIEKLTVHKEISNFRFVVHSIILGCSSYLTLQFILNIFALFRLLFKDNFEPKTIMFWNSLFNAKTPISISEVAYSCLSGILLAFFISAAVQNKWLNIIAKKLKISNKFGDEDLYYYFLNAKEIDWVWVRDEENGYTYEGHVDSFSETKTIRELLLTDVKVYPYDSDKELYHVPALYLSFSKDSPLYIEVPINEMEVNKDEKTKKDN